MNQDLDNSMTKKIDYRKLVLQHSRSRTIAYNPDLAKLLNSVKAGLLLGHLLFWWGKGRNPNYIYKTLAEMEAELGLSDKEQNAAVKKCVVAGFLKTFKKGIPAKRHFIVYPDAITTALKAL